MRAVIALAIMAMATAGAAGQIIAPPRDRSNASASTGTATVSGRVVDAQTGNAIARARVRLDWSGSGSTGPSVTTDSSGRFSFTRLPAGSFMIVVEKSTFLFTRYPTPRQTFRTSSRPVPIADGQTIDDIVVPMYHGGVITGRVVDATGDPVEGVMIQALRLSKGGTPQPRSGTTSNDVGEFRVARLDPGEYLLLATPQQSFQPNGASSPPEPLPTMTFYPGVASITDAQPIAIVRGTMVTGIDLQLVEGQAARVSGRLVDPAGQAITNNAQILVRPIVHDVGLRNFGMSGNGVKADGTFEVTLPFGEYEFVGQRWEGPRPGSPPGSATQHVGITRVTVSGDIHDLAIELFPPAKVSGRFIFEGTRPVPAFSAVNGPGTIGFASSDGSCRGGQAVIAPDWSFTADNISGTCTIRFYGNFPRWFLSTIRRNGEDLLDRPLTFAPAQRVRGIEIVMTDRPTELMFHVTDNRGEPTRDYVGLVFPTDKSRWVDIDGRFLRPLVPPRDPPAVPTIATGGQQSSMSAPLSNAGRREVMVALPPGEYFAIAVDDLETETFRDPDVLERLSRTATRVTLADGAHADVYLRRVKQQLQ